VQKLRFFNAYATPRTGDAGSFCSTSRIVSLCNSQDAWPATSGVKSGVMHPLPSRGIALLGRRSVIGESFGINNVIRYL
jgi:hypothetical protein